MAVYKRYQRRLKLKKREFPKSGLQEMWEQRIADAEQTKKRWQEEFLTKELEKAFYGHQRPDWWLNEGWFTINLIFASFRIMRRNVVPRKLEVLCNLSRSYRADPEAVMQFQAQGDLRRAVLQYFFTQLEVREEILDAYMNAHWEFGVIKVGYAAEMEDNPNAGMVKKLDGDFLFDADGKAVLEPEANVVKEEFFIDSVDPECLLVDKNCQRNPDKTGRWIAHKIFRSVEEVKSDPLYKNTKDLEGSFLEESERDYLRKDEWRTPPSVHGTRATGKHLPEDDLVVLYEIYDLFRGEIITIARGHKEVLRGPEKVPPGIDLHPFIFLKFAERRASFYPLPLIWNWLGPSLEYNIRRNQLALHLKRFGRRYLYNGIDQEKIEQLEDYQDGIYVEVAPNARLEPVKDAPLDSAHYFDTSNLRREFDDLSGVGELQRSRLGAESATEAEIVESRSREGELDEHETVMDFAGKIAEKLHKCVEANLTQEGAVAITGPAGKNWFYFGPENFEPIDGEYLFALRADEAQRNTLMVERAQMLQFLEVIGRNPMLALSPTLLRSVMDKFPALANNELLLKEIHMLAVFQMQMQQQAAAEARQTKMAGGKGGGGKETPTRPREVAEKSRKVAAK